LTTSLIHSLDGRTLSLAGISHYCFSGTSYLGMAFHPEFQQYLLEGISLYGTNYGGSRLSNLQFPVYEAAENHLAQITATEGALTFSSGTLAGQLLSNYLSQTHELCYVPKTHPALWHEANAPVVQDNWINQVLENAKNTSKPLAIFSNSIDPLYCKPTDFSWWQRLPQDRKTVVVLDDSHGFGIVGKKGAGITSTLAVPKHIDLIVSSSLGKAYAVPGGVILGNKKHITALKNSPLFGGASPIIPAYLHAFLESKKLHQQQLKRLRQYIAYFVNYINKSLDFPSSPFQFHFLNQLPVFYTADQKLYERFRRKNIIISSFPYPTKESPCINRIVLNAAHKRADIDYLIAGLMELSATSLDS